MARPPPKSRMLVYSSRHPPKRQFSPSEKGRRADPSTSGPLGPTSSRSHSSARGQPQSGLTLLRVGLRIRLPRSRIQQLFQLQSQGLRLRHGHQVTAGAALVNLHCSPSEPPAARRSRQWRYGPDSTRQLQAETSRRRRSESQ